MSYLVLARKWRPQTFADVVGQESVVRTLQNGLKRNRVAHAMIFSGVRGVGKTTLARIMAKALNCTGATDDKPCNVCESCREITAGNAVDLHEIDGASNRGIQEIRELKENIRFFPTKSRFKVIIIDEVHMLTTEAFNALLKTLEEPPEHVYFMFATTELHKVPITILSRCQRYELKRVSFVDLVAFFAKIATQEQVEISRRAIEMIAREADGSVRDGLSLLDQIFSFGGDRVTDEDVVQVLGLVDQQIFVHLARSLLTADLAQCFDLLEKIYVAGIDLKRFTTDLLAYLRALLICRTSPRPEALLDVSDQELAELRGLSADHSPETLAMLFQLLFKGMTEMQYSAHPRLVLEMAFIKAVQAGQVTPAAALLGRLDEMIKVGGGLQPLPSALPAAKEAEKPPAVVPPKPPVPPLPEKTPDTSREILAVIEPELDSKVQKLEPLVGKIAEPKNREKKGDGAASQTHTKDVRKNWDSFVAYVKERKPWMAQVLKLCENPREEEGKLLVRFDNPSDGTLLQEPEHVKDLSVYALDFFQKDLRVRISSRGDKAGGHGEAVLDGPKEERRVLANDPLVQTAVDVFGGQVGAIRTGPRFR
ncbi:MAG: DNA polymerase III subunit gamma/tau [Proteobacteria bacterium]|nr:DNA polymerase III subunit gamma/tau [Pseudomonadota bacterium]MBU4296904.1 DNA polymerase III subunit gamma/tau [Pseudomonadota bacterium]MCG2749282.1 DNA polymerase III subunit gamma/tau [Desulfobulbaceae bacterium]